MAKTLILLLAIITTLISGDDALMNHPYVTKEAEFHIEGPFGTPAYSCQFNFETYCLWFIDGQRIDIVAYDYTWKIGRGTNNHDCSIRGNSEDTPHLHGHNSQHKIECAGYEPVTKTVELNGSIELQCPLVSNDEKCSWKRNGHRIDVAGRYSYIREHDSSIRISGIVHSDLTTWTCFYFKDGLKWPNASYVLTNEISFEIEEESEQNPINETHTVEMTELPTVSPNEEHDNSSNSTETPSPTEYSSFNSSEATSSIENDSTTEDPEFDVEDLTEVQFNSSNATTDSQTENPHFNSSETISNVKNSSTTADTESHTNQPNEDHLNQSKTMEESLTATINITNSSTTEDPDFYVEDLNEDHLNLSKSTEESTTDDYISDSNETTSSTANSSSTEVTELATDQLNETQSSSLNATEEPPTMTSSIATISTTEITTFQPNGNLSSSFNTDEESSAENTNFNSPDINDGVAISTTHDADHETDHDLTHSTSTSKSRTDERMQNRPDEKVISSEQSASKEAEQEHEANKKTVWTAFGVTCAVVLLLASIVVYLCRRRKQLKKRTLPENLKYQPISLKVPSEDDLHHANATELSIMNKYKTMYGAKQSPEVVYTEVIASKRVSAVDDESHDNGEDVVYSTIIHERPNSKLS